MTFACSESLLPDIAAVGSIDRVRLSYLQPAEMRPTLVEAVVTIPGVAPYFDLSFQHASRAVLRRMRRFGSADLFLDLIQTIRDKCPGAGIRSNVIVGFPGETESDLGTLESFLVAARLDVVGVFGYSDEDGTEAAGSMTSSRRRKSPTGSSASPPSSTRRRPAGGGPDRRAGAGHRRVGFGRHRGQASRPPGSRCRWDDDGDRHRRSAR